MPAHGWAVRRWRRRRQGSCADRSLFSRAAIRSVSGTELEMASVGGTAAAAAGGAGGVGATPHVLAVDDSSVDRAIIAAILRSSRFRGVCCVRHCCIASSCGFSTPLLDFQFFIQVVLVLCSCSDGGGKWEEGPGTVRHGTPYNCAFFTNYLSFILIWRSFTRGFTPLTLVFGCNIYRSRT